MPEQEKITINMSAVDLGKIDLLVQESLFSNRTDFIRTAIRNQLDKHAVEIQQSVTRHSYGLGAYFYSKSDFEKSKLKGEKVAIKIVGLLHFPNDLTPELASEVVDSIELRGIFHASVEVKAALADRMK
jgi:Arc/MetJ-type ribon-helix-helix transcriptional regulator